jgi:hypothetical protein
MATVAADGLNDGGGLSMGRVFGGATDTVRAWPAQTIGLLFVLGSLPWLLVERLAGMPVGSAAAAGAMLDGVDPGMQAVGIVLALLIAVAAMVAFTAVTQAAVLHGLGQRPEWHAILRTGEVRAVPLVVVYVLYWIAITFGLMLLVVPGVILGVVWAVAGVAAVAERPGILGAFGRSRALTRGARWQVFGVLLVGVVVYSLASSLGLVLVALGGGIGGLIGQIGSGLVNSVVLAWVVALWASLYVQLRRWKDGPETAALADIFA